jgi:hypothetical protein
MENLPLYIGRGVICNCIVLEMKVRKFSLPNKVFDLKLYVF